MDGELTCIELQMTLQPLSTILFMTLTIFVLRVPWYLIINANSHAESENHFRVDALPEIIDNRVALSPLQ